jgi:hypothetical protein
MTIPPASVSGWVRSLFWIEGLSVPGLLLLAPAILGSKTSGRGMGAIGLVVFVGAWALCSLLAAGMRARDRKDGLYSLLVDASDPTFMQCVLDGVEWTWC